MPSQTEKRKIGKFIATMREQKGMTQKDLAQALKTSQSAVARMEAGEQNFSTEMLSKVSQALARSIVSLSSGGTNLQIEGGHKLSGTITTNSSKNATVAILAGALLNKGTTTLKGVPRIEEVHRLVEVLKSIDVTVTWSADHELTIRPPKKLTLKNLDREAAMRTRSILLFLGPLIHLLPEFSLPRAGGCLLGKRTVMPHLFALEKFGVKIQTTRNSYKVASKKLKSAEVVMFESGDTTTENAIMAAARLPGKSVIKFASANYQVQDLCFFLESLGVKIAGIGTTTLVIHGKADINKAITYHIAEDPIESMLFITAAIVTKGELTIKRCPIDFLELELLKLEKMGLKYSKSKTYKAKNGRTSLVDLVIKPSDLLARGYAEKIHPDPYPGLNIDNLPFFVLIATQAKGKTLIHDWVYEKRALYYAELTKLGADIVLGDPHRAFIAGPTPLKAAEVMCPPALRPGAIVLLGMLAAEGTSVLRNNYTIARGYEDIVERLNSLGAKISVMHEM